MEDMSQYMGEYIKEAEEHLENLNNALLGLEKNPLDEEFINQLFRSAHTLKSSSAAMGFAKISELAHSMEDVLGRLRQKEILADRSVVDLLFNCFDSLESMIAKVTKGGKEDDNIEPLLENLKKMMEIEKSNEPINIIEKKESLVAGDSGGDLAYNAHTLKSVNFVKVDLDRLDKLMNLVGELLVTKMRVNQLKIEKNLNFLNESLNQLSSIISELQFEVMQIRLIPVGHIFNRFPRMIRDLSEKENKKINFLIEGEEIELDRTIIDNLGEPLVHLLRNSVDHGIELPEERKKSGKDETGTIKLVAKKERNTAIIEVIDDGAGFDIERIKEVAITKGIYTKEDLAKMSEEKIVMIPFLGNFSTSKVVTDVSGRGVGLDVVKTKIEGMNGKVSVESKPGKGIKFSLELPLTLAILPCFLIRVAMDHYGIPLANVIRSVKINTSEIRTVSGYESFILENTDLPLIRLGNVFNHDKDFHEELLVVIVELSKQRFGIVVDQLLGEEDLMIKPLDGLLRNTKGFSGATILGDGKVLLILDINSLIENT